MPTRDQLVDQDPSTRPRAQLKLNWDGPPALHPTPLRSAPQRQLLNQLGQRATRGRAIVERLRRGPATSLELLQAGGLRYHARLRELRERGFIIQARPEGDIWTYTLVAEPLR